MLLKIIFLACLAVAFAVPIGPIITTGYGAWNPYGNYGANYAVSAQHSNILRSPFNLGQVSTDTKAIDTPFSSVRKSDIRISNPGLAVAPAYTRLAAPLVSHIGVAAPYTTSYAAPVAKVATTAGLLGVAYSPASAVSHMTYTNGLGLTYGW
ncbi:unnamed protein product [Arctia plantaginis]|uniref:Uncharacterized protein n=1 Tax=Arctia plantaginis TaxID=874455 RepID=A0A8S1BCZ5_ARCPL|nr:unnamed protein product [Arctia plantaginis]